MPDHAIPHWAHNPLPDGTLRNCTNDRGEMSEWHLEWQHQRADVTDIEVVRGDHRADVRNPSGIVIEFQNSSIDPEDVAAREAHWSRGVWVVNGTGERDDGSARVTVRRLPDQDPSDPYRSIQWPHAPKLLYRAKWPIWIDVGPDVGLIQVRNFDGGRGNGWLVTHEWFITEVVNGRMATLRSHKPRQQPSRYANKQLGHARTERLDDPDLYDIHCIRVDQDPIPSIPVWSTADPKRNVTTPLQETTRAVVMTSIDMWPVTECCGQCPPGVKGEQTVSACQLCPESPTYWKRR
jgi:hypothetical protein